MFSRWKPSLSVAVPIFIFLALACRHLGLAGLYDDEAIFGVAALKIADALRSGRLGSMPSGVLLYHGIIQSWMIVPFIAWMRFPSALALRAPFVIAGAGAVYFLHRLALHALKSRALAFFAALLLAMSPTFIVGVHFGAFFNTATVFFTASALWSLCVWLENGEELYFGLAALSIGLSCSTIAQAVVLAASFIAAMLYCLAFERRPRRGKAALYAGGFLLIGLAPLLWHLSRGMPRLLEGIAKRFSGPPWRPRDFLLMAERLHGLLDGTGLLTTLAERPSVAVSSGNHVFPLIYCGALGVLAYAGFRRPPGKGAESGAGALARVLVVLNLSYWICGSVLVRLLDYLYFTNWQPIPQITVAAALYWLTVLFGRRSKTTVAAVVLLAASALADVLVLDRFFVYLKTTRGEDRFSSAVYDLSDWLRREDIRRAVTLTWGSIYNLTYLSGGDFQVSNAWDDPGDNALSRDMRASKPVYLIEYVRSQELYLGNYIKPERTFDAMTAAKYVCEERKSLADACGEPVLRVLRCAPGGSAAED